MVRTGKFLILTLLLAAVVQYLPKQAYAGGSTAGAAESGYDRSTITVSGSASVMVVPDEVEITVGIETLDRNIGTAKALNSEQSNKVTEIAKNYNIESKDIQTDYLRIEPRYNRLKEEKDFTGYYVQRRIVITLKDMTRFENLVSSMLEAGANEILGIQFKTSGLREKKNEARIQAIRASKEKASSMAAELGLKVGKACSIKEEQDDVYSWYSSWWRPSYGGLASNAIINAGGNDQTSGDGIEPGRIAVRARVTVIYELE